MSKWGHSIELRGDKTMRKKSKAKRPLAIEHIIENLEIPKETILNIPIISLIGNKDLVIENFNNILEYGEKVIRLNTKSGVLAIQGEKLEAKSMTNESIKIKGYIESISFSK